MTGIFLLDTNAAIAQIDDDERITILLNKAVVYLSTIALGELYYGAERSGRVDDNLRDVDSLASRVIILVCDEGTARQYGRIHQHLRAKGRPIPQNDIWIAATALQHNLTLLTRDAHFDHIDGLAVQNW